MSVKVSRFYRYINTTPTSSVSPTYARLGEGMSSLTPSLNGNIEEKQYINSDVPKKTRTSYGKQWAFSADYDPTDPAQEYLYSLAEKTEADVATYLIELYCDDASKKSFTAKKYPVIVDISNDGGLEGGGVVSMEGTIHATGEAETGTFDISTNTFTTA